MLKKNLNEEPMTDVTTLLISISVVFLNRIKVEMKSNAIKTM
ncbi:hypothetical protein R0K30_17245 [Bacillus sp. SIMBA_154]